MVKKPNNPFLLVGYHSPGYFCDREQETARMLEAIQNQRNLTLYSIRRMGKTALIKHVFHHLPKSRHTTALYVDLMPTNNFDDMAKRLAEAIVLKYGNPHKGISAKLQQLLSAIGAAISFDPMTGMPVVNLQYHGQNATEQSLQSLLAFLADQKEQVVLAFDEFQQIAQYPATQPEAFLRTLVQEYNSLRFIFSGSHQGIMTAMFTHQGRPFYRSTQVIPLKPIDRQAYKAFIRHHFESSGKKVTEAATDNMLTWCKQQTYYVQLLCNRLFARYDEVNEGHLQTIWEEIIEEEEAIFHNYKNLLTQKQWDVLGGIAKEEPVKHPNAHDFLQRFRLGAASSVQSAVKALRDKQLLTWDENGYAVQDALLARWLQQH
jgi:hypothetical protein